MVREDFLFTIGYDGNQAIVDKAAKAKYGSLDTKQLAEQGLFKPAFSSAVFSGKEEELKLVLDEYNKASKSNYTSVDDLKKLFGVFSLPENITKIVYI